MERHDKQPAHLLSVLMLSHRSELPIESKSSYDVYFSTGDVSHSYDILVNRGYVPYDLRDPSTRRAGQVR